jgi:CheY-like chemotaxis protein
MTAKILFIEDEPLTLDMGTRLLEAKGGYIVLTAKDGVEGFEMIRAHRPDLVLCDIQMPRMKGTELLEKLRAELPDLANMPFLFMTAYVEDDNVKAGYRLGADDYITKPVDWDNVVVRVDARLRQVQRMEVLATKEHDRIHRTFLAHVPKSLQVPLDRISSIADVLRLSGRAGGPKNSTPLGPEALALVDEVGDLSQGLSIDFADLIFLADASGRGVQLNDHTTNIAREIVTVAKWAAGTKPALGRQIEIATEIQAGLPDVILDLHLMRHTLNHLLTNAIAFSPDHGQITVRAYVADPRLVLPPSVTSTGPEIGDRASFVPGLVIDIVDQGPGIQAAEVKRAFRPFDELARNGRLDEAAEQVTGIGLALARASVLAHGGILELLAGDGGTGCCARIVLPARRVVAPAEPAAAVAG